MILNDKNTDSGVRISSRHLPSCRDYQITRLPTDVSTPSLKVSIMNEYNSNDFGNDDDRDTLYLYIHHKYITDFLLFSSQSHEDDPFVFDMKISLIMMNPKIREKI